MADNNDKLSLHIGSIKMNSGFVDVPAIPTISGRLTLNRQTVVGIGGGDVGPAGITATGGAFAHSAVHGCPKPPPPPQGSHGEFTCCNWLWGSNYI